VLEIANREAKDTSDAWRSKAFMGGRWVLIVASRLGWGTLDRSGGRNAVMQLSIGFGRGRTLIGRRRFRACLTGGKYTAAGTEASFMRTIRLDVDVSPGKGRRTSEIRVADDLRSMRALLILRIRDC
jgi:hypothetical protein